VVTEQSSPVTTFFHGNGFKMQNVVTVFRILIYQKRHIFVQFLYQKIPNNVGYSYMFLTQKPGLTTFYHCSDEIHK